MSTDVLFDDLFDDETEVTEHEQSSVKSKTKLKKIGVPIKTQAGNKKVLPHEAAARAVAVKMNTIIQEIKSEVLERDDVIHDLVRSVMTKDHILLLGPPGSAKSFLARIMCLHIDSGKYFEWLMNRTTDPSAILGPYKIKEMEKGHFTRNMTGMLPEADLCFIDEIGKSNEPALNILLAILNERVIHDDGIPKSVPLRTMIAASNEELQDDCSALDDRIAYHHEVNKIQNRGNKIKMRQMERDRRENGGKYIPKTIVTIQELELLEEYINAIEIPQRVDELVEDLQDTLNTNYGIVVSDRRANMTNRILQAEAVLQGRDKVSPKDLVALLHVFALKPTDVPKVKSEILKLVDPYASAIKIQTDRVKQIKKDIEGIDNPVNRRKAIINAKANLEAAIKQLEQIKADMEADSEDTKKVNREIKSTDKLLKEYVQEALGYDPNLAAKAKSKSSVDEDENQNEDDFEPEGDMPF